MNLERYIARRITFSNNGKERISRPVIRIAILGIALGFSIMVLAVFIVNGFKREIREKLIGFNAHIQISHFDQNYSYETSTISNDPGLTEKLRQLPDVAHVQRFATKAGIIKNGADLEGVVAKGIGNDYDWSFFNKYLVDGHVFTVQDSTRGTDIVISKNTATKLNLKTGDSLNMYFIQQPPRARRFRIAGIYQTGLEEFDNLYLFCDIGQIRVLNDWAPDKTGGYEITLKNFNRIDEATEQVYQTLPPDLNARSVKELYPQIFDWLELQNINAWIIIALMIVVSGINMISALLVIILERVQMIGTLKSIGSSDASIRKVFLWVASYIIGRGLVIGNIAGLGIAGLQHYFKIIPLDETSYYISHVPVQINLTQLALLNAGTLALCVLMMILPTLLVTSIRPVNALRYS